MTYFKINGADFSHCVNSLKIDKENKYSLRTNARGKVQAKYQGASYLVDVGIIPLDAGDMSSLLSALNDSKITISFLDAETRQLKTIDCILLNQTVDYYTIQNGNVKFKGFNLTFTEAVVRG